MSGYRQPYPWRVGAGLMAATLLVAGVFYLFTQYTAVPNTSQSALALSTEAPSTLDARPTPAGVATTTSQEAPGPVRPATPASVPATPASVPAGTANPTPSTPAQAVGEAYLRYFKVRALATYYLDPTLLPAVAADQALAGLRQSIETSRAEHRAVRTSVEQHYRVINLQTDTADVADNYRDMSVWVDATTLQPLPGQVAPASADVAPEVRALYHLRLIEGLWKVVGGDRQ